MYIYNLNSRAVEASFYGDAGRMVVFFHEVKQRTF